MSLPSPVTVLSGFRTPFARAYGNAACVHAADLGTAMVAEVLRTTGLNPGEVDELIFGNVGSPPDTSNIARVIALDSGLPRKTIAHTVNRNCGSGMEAVLQGCRSLSSKRSSLVVAGGTESMSRLPALLSEETTELLRDFAKARSLRTRAGILLQLRPRHFRPVWSVTLGLTDPTCGLSMGETAELLAEEFGVSRRDQDLFACESHQRAADARGGKCLQNEIRAVRFTDCVHSQRLGLAGSAADAVLSGDDCIREAQSPEKLARLRPVFRPDGTVTAGNSCPLTDGAAALLLQRAADPIRQAGRPLGTITAAAVAGCDPSRMGLGPVYAVAKLLRETGLTLRDFDLFEINEAFAAQVLACLAAFSSDAFCRKELHASGALGEIPRERLNVRGGAIALGHPVGATGARLVLTMLHSLRCRGEKRGLVSLCVGGGQGMAMVIESAD